MSKITEAQLEKAQVSCSICGNGFSAANPATIIKVKNETFKGEPVYAGVCSKVPYVQKHSKKDTSYKVLYASADNKAGFVTLMSKSLDKDVHICPYCKQEIKEVKKISIKKGNK